MQKYIHMEEKNAMYSPYKIHCFDEYGKIKKTYIFVGDDESDKNFSEDNIEAVVVHQQIHPDDSIRVIKNKIINAIGENVISYNELCLFITISKQMDVLDLYQKYTQKNKTEFTREHVIQLLKNMNYDESIIETIRSNTKTHYFYDDLVEYIDTEKNTMNIPLGIKFSNHHDPFFSANPYDYQDGIFVPSAKNKMFASDNLLLLNYGRPLNNAIHVCFAEDVLEHAIQNAIKESTITQTYFPLLFEDDEINSKTKLLQDKDAIINKSKSRANSGALLLYKSIDFFYDVFKKRMSDLAYSERGITYYSVLLHNNLQTKLPLEIIFKNIHATKTVPFIKYNPGQMRENIYRLYSEKISRNGKKIPFLSETAIMQLSRKIGKRNQISLYTENDITVDFESNGNIRVYGELKHPILPSELSEIIRTSVNPIIHSINDFLNKSGYHIPEFHDIYDDVVEVLDIKYIASIVVENEVVLQKYIKCLYGIFTIYDANISHPAKLAYKRVQNFHEMDEQTMFIKQIYKATEDVSVMIDSIKQQFQVSDNAAQKMFAEYLQNKDVISGQNPGFPTIIRSEPLENKIIVEVSNIIHIEYVRILHMYIDSLFRITQNPDSTNVPKNTITEICKNAEKISKDIEKSYTRDEIFIPLPAQEEEEEKLYTVDEFQEDLEPTLKDLENDILEDDDALFYEDDEEGDDLFKGGEPETEYKMELAGTSLHNPNLFEDRMKKREPYLFTTKSGKFTNYSTLCQSSAKKQPVILTQEEKDKIDAKDKSIGSKSYKHAIKYGTDPAKPYWYICPRYWCLQTNTSMTEEEVRAGKCGTKPYPHNIIPDGADTIPEGAYVIEFKSSKHVNKDGSYKFYNPGVLSRKTDDGFCIPCCYGEWKSGLWQTNKEKCPAYIEDDDDDENNPKNVKKPRKKQQTKKQENYVMGIDKFPIGQGRWGLLPFSVQSFLQTDNSVCISKTNQVISNKDNCLLRFGVEKSDNQSFLACMAAMYAYKQDLDTTPTLSEFKQILSNTITLDMFIGYYNASLVATFKPKRIYREKINLDKYSTTKFINTINMEDDIQVDFLEDTIAAFENFLEFLKSDSATIDHSYLWDMATQNHPNLMKGGYNLVILEIQKDDMRDNMQILCPSHSQSNVLYDPTKETVILIMQTNKQGTYFEPIYVYSEDPAEIQYAFTEQTSPDNLKNMLSIIQKTTNQYCAPLPSMPKKYHFKKNKQAQDVLNILKEHNYEVDVQVLNYQGNVIGLYVKSDDEQVYIPCYPSTELPLLEKWWMDDDDLWHDYEATRNRLVSVHQKTNGKILCSPQFKVIEDGMIVGILTETNQFVQISPISENIFQDGLLELDSSNYLIADKIITTSQNEDPKRNDIVRKIELETQYFSLFRSIVRAELHEYKNKDIRKEIIHIIDNNELTIRERLNNMIIQLRKLLSNQVQFSAIDQSILAELMKCRGQDCLTILANNQTIFPSEHLLSGVNNENVYYGRVADELLRYRRVQLFMLNPASYLNIGYSEYVIFDTEMLMLQSLLTPEYFADLVVFNDSEFLKRVNYTNAFPAISQSYSKQPITLEEQNKIVSIEKKPGELNIDCVQKIRDEVQGNERSMWKRIFPKPAKEVVFHATPFCSFYMIIYIIENVYKSRKSKTNVNITISNVKSVLWTAYKEYIDSYDENYAKIESILKIQGKRKLFSGNSTLEEIIASEGYFLSDLDVWVIATKLRLPIVLFSSTSLKSLFDPTKKVDWLLMGGTNIQKDKYFCVRSPSTAMEYQLIIPPSELTNPELTEFYSIVQKSAIEKSDNVKDLQQYLVEYKYKTIVLKK